jgi:hypothetical protein
MSPLRQRMIEEMKLAGLAPATQAIYIAAVCSLAAYYRRSPDELSEEEVRPYLLSLRERGVARGTFKTIHYGIQFLYCNTLNRDWPLFSKKDPPAQAEAFAQCPGRQPCPQHSPPYDGTALRVVRARNRCGDNTVGCAATRIWPSAHECAG